jgi:hypothetical protein
MAWRLRYSIPMLPTSSGADYLTPGFGSFGNRSIGCFMVVPSELEEIDRRLKELGREYSSTSEEDPRRPEIVNEISVLCSRRHLLRQSEESSST